VEIGINLIDTAEMYGSGKSEEIIGNLISEYREDIVIASKVHPYHFTYRSVKKAFQGSINRLKTDYIDFYYVHWPNPIIPMH